MTITSGHVTAIIAVCGLLWAVLSTVIILIGTTISGRLRSMDEKLDSLRLNAVTHEVCEKRRQECAKTDQDHEARLRALEQHRGTAA